MSEQAEKETEMVVGTISAITQKGPDKWQVAVKPEGSQYAKNLWTKDGELVGSLSQKIGQHGAFVCGVSNWTNQSGQDVRSLWINSVGDEQRLDDLHVKVNSPAPTSDGMTPEKWDAKERRDYRSRAWAQTLGAFSHTIKVDEEPAAAFARLQPFQRKVYEDVCGMFAYPVDEEDIPF